MDMLDVKGGTDDRLSSLPVLTPSATVPWGKTSSDSLEGSAFGSRSAADSLWMATQHWGGQKSRTVENNGPYGAKRNYQSFQGELAGRGKCQQRSPAGSMVRGWAAQTSPGWSGGSGGRCGEGASQSPMLLVGDGDMYQRKQRSMSGFSKPGIV